MPSPHVWRRARGAPGATVPGRRAPCPCRDRGRQRELQGIPHGIPPVTSQGRRRPWPGTRWVAASGSLCADPDCSEHTPRLRGSVPGAGAEAKSAHPLIREAAAGRAERQGDLACSLQSGEQRDRAPGAGGGGDIGCTQHLGASQHLSQEGRNSSIGTPGAPGKHCWVFCSQQLGQRQDQPCSVYGAALPKLLSSIQRMQGRRELASQQPKLCPSLCHQF